MPPFSPNDDTRQAFVSFPGYGEIPAQGELVGNRFMVDGEWLNGWLKSEFTVDLTQRQNSREVIANAYTKPLPILI